MYEPLRLFRILGEIYFVSQPVLVVGLLVYFCFSG